MLRKVERIVGNERKEEGEEEGSEQCVILLETCCLSCVTVRSDIMQRAVHLSKNFYTLQFQSII